VTSRHSLATSRHSLPCHLRSPAPPLLLGAATSGRPPLPSSQAQSPPLSRPCGPPALPPRLRCCPALAAWLFAAYAPAAPLDPALYATPVQPAVLGGTIPAFPEQSDSLVGSSSPCPLAPSPTLLLVSSLYLSDARGPALLFASMADPAGSAFHPPAPVAPASLIVPTGRPDAAAVHAASLPNSIVVPLPTSP
jgi:hypothetical protein